MSSCVLKHTENFVLITCGKMTNTETTVLKEQFTIVLLSRGGGVPCCALREALGLLRWSEGKPRARACYDFRGKEWIRWGSQAEQV